MEIKELGELLSIAKSTNNYSLIRYLTGKPYNRTKLIEEVFSTKYEVLGGGVIETKYLENYNSKEGLRQLTKYFTPIKNEEDYKNFLTRLNEEEKILQEKKEKESQNWLQELDIKLSSLNLETTQKEKIRNIVITCPSNKHELEKYFWEIVDMNVTQTNAVELLNIRLDIKIDKNTYTKKKRNKGEI